MADNNTAADAIHANIHTLSVERVYAALDSQTQGLAQAEATRRLERYGPNKLREIKRTPLALKFLSNFTHLMALLLWAGGLIGFLAQMPQLGIAIWTVNLINGAFSFWQEYKAEQATAALRRLLPSYARVLRDGEERRVSAEELVPGDVLLLAEGEHVSADARLVQAAELRVDQSALTGESYPVRKTSQPAPASVGARAEVPNLIFASTSVVAGAGQGIAVSASIRGLLHGTTPAERAPVLAATYLLCYTGAMVPSLIAGQLSHAFSLVQLTLGYGALAVIATVVTLIGARDPD